METLKKMKWVFFTIIMCINFSACEKDDENFEKDIIGKWSMVKTSGYRIENGERIDLNDPIPGFFIIFEKDGSGYNSKDNERAYFRWKIKNNKLYRDFDTHSRNRVETIKKINDDTMILNFKEKNANIEENSTSEYKRR